MLILEGCDLSGKSTIGKRISELTGRKIFAPAEHFKGRPKDLNDINDRFNFINQLDHDEYVLDRHPFISEFIYGTILNRGSLVSAEMLTEFLEMCKPTILFCDPGILHIMTNIEHLKTKPHKEQNHVDGVASNLPNIWHMYRQVMGGICLERTCPIHVINFKNITDDLLRSIIANHNERIR